MTTHELSQREKTITQLPVLFRDPSAGGTRRFWEFFTVHIRNPYTRAAYFHVAQQFAEWCGVHRLTEHVQVQPVHIAAYVESVLQRRAKPTAKQHLAALRRLFDWLVLGQIVGSNPAASVCGPRYSVTKGKTTGLAEGEAQAYSRAWKAAP